MSNHFKTIYTSQADLYDQLVTKEDMMYNVTNALLTIRHIATSEVIELGAGTGRLTRWFSTHAKKIIAFDLYQHMLEHLQSTLKKPVMLAVADNRALPIPDASSDMTVAGWSFGHAIGWYPDNWDVHIQQMLREMARITRPNGTMVVIETLGTGYSKPMPPSSEFVEYYDYLRNIGFLHRWVRSDYRFDTVEQAEKLIRFFFGDELADHVRQNEMTVVPECTGIWWKHV